MSSCSSTEDVEKVYEFVHNLTWTHIRRLLSVTNEVARKWYLENALRDMWSTTTLDRNISSQYFETVLDFCSSLSYLYSGKRQTCEMYIIYAFKHIVFGIFFKKYFVTLQLISISLAEDLKLNRLNRQTN